VPEVDIDVFGYSLASRIVGTLCRIITHAPVPTRIQIVLIQRHIDTVRAIIREGVHTTDNTTGINIFKRPATTVETFPAQEFGEDYADIAGDVEALPKIEAPKL